MASKKKEKKPPVQDRISPDVFDAIRAELSQYTGAMKDAEKRKAKDKFMDLYQKVEFVYKKLLVEYRVVIEGEEAIPGYKAPKGKKEKKFDPDNLKIYETQAKKVLIFADLSWDDRLFVIDEEHKQEKNKSCRVLRNEITHSNSRKAVDEVYSRRQELYSVMNQFLYIFSEEPQKEKTA